MYWQFISQIVSLVLFVFLASSGRAQVWVGVFAASVIAAPVLGRAYCGWVCPIHTGMRGIAWAKRKLRIGSARIPAWLTRPWARMAFLGLFAAAFIFTMVSGKKLPVLPALFALGIALTLFFPEELWHRYLCPYGLILSLPARKSRRAMAVRAELCNQCGMCARVCPAKAVKRRENQHEIIPKDCMVCMECARACRQKAIGYR